MGSATLTDAETLAFAAQYGMIDLDDVRAKMMDAKKEDILATHNHKITQTTNGRWMTRIDDPTATRGMRQVFKKNRDDLLEYLIAYYEKRQPAAQNKNITLRELYSKWLEHKKLYTTAVTSVSRIGSDWLTYYVAPTTNMTTTTTGRKLKTPTAPIPNIIDVPIAQLDVLQCDEWAHALILAYSMTKTCYYDATLIIRQMLEYAASLHIITDSPFAHVKIDAARMFRHTQKKQDSTQVFSAAEEIAFRHAAEREFETRGGKFQLTPMAALFQFQTGLRVGELCAIKFEDLNEKPGYLHVQRMYRKIANTVVPHTKTACGDRYVILTKTAKKIITTVKKRRMTLGLPCTGYIFSTDKNAVPEYVIVRLYARLCKQAKIAQKSSHKVRKTYISALLDAGVNINTVRAQVGHTDERTTLSCYCFDRKDEPEKVAQIDAALA